MVLDIEPMTWKVTRCAAIENLYLSDTDSRFECMEQLRDSLIRLYKTILIYQLHVISYLTENKVG
jgi:hypothetical protein